MHVSTDFRSEPKIFYIVIKPTGKPTAWIFPELGQRGGKGKGAADGLDLTGYVHRPLRNADDVTKLLADTINYLCSGAMDTRIANILGYLATAMLKAMQEGDVEGRLRAIEAVLTNHTSLSKR